MKYLATLFLLTGILCLPQYENIQSLSGVESRIVGGQIAKPHQFPYTVGIRLIRQKDGVEYTSWCGGSLISNRAVLTAGHCMRNTVRVLLHFVCHNRWDKTEPNRVTIEVGKKNFIVHPDFKYEYLYNDIALIMIPDGVTLSDKIQIVNLPRRRQGPLENLMAIASGWGKAGYKIGASEILRFVQLKVVDNDQCGNFGTLKPEQLCCDGHGPKSTCEGDSGGPLVLQESDGSKTLIGLTSFGAYTCEDEYPMVFTRVTSFLDWISKNTDIQIRD
uniref:Venom polypeptide n=1 Tax=Dolopus genitalis TaxID=2488630 RepID=A0A3G5BII7_DOLGE|nr:venom polypeptide [Dolopus genitalis]